MGSHSDWVARHRLLRRRLAPGLRRPRHDGQADRGGHAAVRRQHHVDHARGAQGGHRSRSPAIRSATRSSSAAPTACPSSTASSAQTVRVIGDDSNLIREFPAMPGRVFSVAVSRRRQADRRRQQPRRHGRGRRLRLRVRHRACPTTSRRSWRRSPAPARPRRRPTLEKYHDRGVKLIAKTAGRRRPASTRSPSGPTASAVAAAGGDGIGPADRRRRAARSSRSSRPPRWRDAPPRTAGRRRRPSPREREEPRRGRDAARRARPSRRSRSQPASVELEQPLRLRPAARHRPSSPRATRST